MLVSFEPMSWFIILLMLIQLCDIVTILGGGGFPIYSCVFSPSVFSVLPGAFGFSFLCSHCLYILPFTCKGLTQQDQLKPRVLFGVMDVTGSLALFIILK